MKLFSRRLNSPWKDSSTKQVLLTEKKPLSLRKLYLGVMHTYAHHFVQLCPLYTSAQSSSVGSLS
jgi:hypothetical protein